jgi:hypothetical protein
MRVLWFDDNSEFVDRVGDFVRQLGHEIRTECTWDGALKACLDTAFDLVVSDWRLEGSRTGNDFFRELERVGLQSGSRWCLASYHYDGARAQDDPVPESSIPEKVEPVVIEAGSVDTLERFERTLWQQLTGTSDVTALPFRAYAALELGAREELLDRVYDQHHARIEESLRDSVWLLICGPNGAIVQTARTQAEIPTDDEIWSLAEDIGYAPFHYFSEDVVDDCAVAGGDLADYPTVTLELTNAEVSPLSVHFDTGSSQTYLDGRLFSNGVVRVPGGRNIRTPTSLTRVRGSLVQIDGLLQCQVTEQTAAVSFMAVVATNWQTTNLARRCDAVRCQSPTATGLCRYRRGLIGRNLLLDSGITLMLVPMDGSKTLATKLGDSRGPLSRLGRILRRGDGA